METLGNAAVTAGADAVHLEPKRFALLAYLAVEAARHPISRDTVLSVFWPDKDPSAGRLALRQALHYLARRLGSPVVTNHGWNEVGLAPGVKCDASRMMDLLGRGKLADALRLHRGEFLAGFYYTRGSRPFESWLDTVRARMRSLAFLAMLDLSLSEETRGNVRSAARWAERGLSLSPYHEGLLRRLLSLYEDLGDHGRADEALSGFESRMRDMIASPTDAMILADHGGVTRTSEFLQALIGGLGLGIIVVDEALRVTVWNERSQELWGLRADEVLGRKLPSLDTGFPVRSIAGAVVDAIEGNTKHAEMTIEGRDRHASALRCHVAIVGFPLQDRAAGALIAMDIVPA